MIKEKIRQVPVLGNLAIRVRRSLAKPVPQKVFTSSGDYWETRYKEGGNSGSGSYDELAEFKAEVINQFVNKNGIHDVIEFGCGDGNQLTYFDFKSYLGFDISPTIIALCTDKYRKDASKHFKVVDSYDNELADLTMSLDVIYHLVEDDVYNEYMFKLFNSSKDYVIVYSSNESEHENNGIAKHVKHRKFTDWVKQNAPEFELIEKVPNRYPYDGNGAKTSYADFYMFKKK